MQANSLRSTTRAVRIAAVLTLLATGRAMTVAFVARAGDGGPGDPPAAWLMPLVGDAGVGVLAPVIAFLLWRVRRPSTWLAALVWGAIAVFDAGAAFLIEWSSPWPEFFMLDLFGRWMFAAAVVLHLVVLALLARRDVRRHFGIPDDRPVPALAASPTRSPAPTPTPTPTRTPTQ